MLSFRSFLKEELMSTWATLQHNDLTKRGGDRLEVFFDKIRDGDEFLTKKGLVKIDKEEVNRLELEMPQRGYSTTIKAGSNTLNYPKDFFKTPEFGGKGKGAGTAAEDRYLGAFEKEIERVLTETGMPYLDLRIGKRTVRCSGIRSTAQTGRRAPKADFSIFDTNGDAVAWISHKAGRTGADFQQYGGLTDSIYNNIGEVQKFASDAKAKFPDGFKSGNTVYRKVEDEKVLGIAIYGLEYGNSKRSKENVDEFHQGPMKLKKVGKVWEIISNHKGFNGDIPTGSHEAYYVARYTSNVKYLGIPNARVGVFPKGKIPRTAEEI